MGNIVLLDDMTVNKIAAGEVIERPSAVVKEMVENSIDAGAKNITVEIKNGGISYIKVSDDGIGIASDDMEIAFERHATSKIRSAKDLPKVMTMGFRGEALASVAAVSKVEMISKRKEDAVAHKIIIEAGKKLEFTEAARSNGTTITVENLFFNTPVRYKFLRKDYTEAGYVEDVVTRLALVNKDVSIKLINNGKTVISTIGNGEIKDVIYSIFGKDIAEDILPVDYEFENIHITGVAGSPTNNRGNRANQFVYLNGRYIKDKNITAAVDLAYKGLLPSGRYAFLVLELEMNPELVDVNVHPAKLEVRFQEEGSVFKSVYNAIKMALEGTKENKPEKKTKNIGSLFSKDKEEKEELDISNNPLAQIYKERQNEAKKTIDDKNEEIDKAEEKEESKDDVKIDALENKEESKDDAENKEEKADVEDTAEEKNYTEMSNQEKIAKFIRDYHNSKNGIREILQNKKISDLETEDIKITIDEPDDSLKEIEDNSVEDTDIKEANNIESTQVLPKIKNENYLNEEDIDETQVIDISNANGETEATSNIENIKDIIKKEEDNLGKETMVLDTEKIKVSEETRIVDRKDNKENSVAAEEENDEEVIKPEEKQSEEIIDSIKKSEEEFTSFAESLLSSKIDSQSTQIIDTKIIREKLAEEENSEKTPEFEEMYKKTFGVEPFSVRKEKEIEKEKIDASNDFLYATENENIFEKNEEENDGEIEMPYRYVGEAFGSYIVIELKDEMYVVDGNALRKRIIYENLKDKFYKLKEDSQTLLLPDVIEVSKEEFQLAKENEEMFSGAGFVFEEFGENTIKLVAVPEICENLNTKNLFLDVLDCLDTVSIIDTEEKEKRFINVIATQISENDKVDIDENEVKKMMSKLLKFKNPFSSPDNKPIAIKMTKYDLDKKFSRR